MPSFVAANQINDAGRRVYYRRTRNTHFLAEGAALSIGGRHCRCAGRYEAYIPVGTAVGIISIEGIDRIVLGSNDQNIMCSAADFDVRDVERLRVDLTVNRAGPTLAEIAAADGSRRKRILLQILTGPRGIDVKRKYAL